MTKDLSEEIREQFRGMYGEPPFLDWANRVREFEKALRIIAVNGGMAANGTTCADIAREVLAEDDLTKLTTQQKLTEEDMNDKSS